MSEVRSKIGSVPFSSEGAPRTFSVSDESGYVPEPKGHSGPDLNHQEPIKQLSREEAEAYRRELIEKSSREASSAIKNSKSRIEMLMGLTSASEEVDIGGVKFVLRTLKTRERNKISERVLLAKSNLVGLVESKLLTLAYAISTIDGVDVDVFFNITASRYETEDDLMSERIRYLEMLEEFVVDTLHKQYVTMSNRISDKYGIKDEESAKEVSEEVRKSS